VGKQLTALIIAVLLSAPAMADDYTCKSTAPNGFDTLGTAALEQHHNSAGDLIMTVVLNGEVFSGEYPDSVNPMMTAPAYNVDGNAAIEMLHRYLASAEGPTIEGVFIERKTRDTDDVWQCRPQEQWALTLATGSNRPADHGDPAKTKAAAAKAAAEVAAK